MPWLSCSLCGRHSRLVSDFFVVVTPALGPGGDWFTETQLALAWTKRTFVPLTASQRDTGSLRITLLVKDLEVLLQIKIRILFVVWGDVVSMLSESWAESPPQLIACAGVSASLCPHSTAPAHGCVAFFPWCQRNVHSVLIINIALGRNLHVRGEVMLSLHISQTVMLWALKYWNTCRNICSARMSQNSCFPLANRAPCPHMYTHVPAWVINQAWFLLRVRDGATPQQSNLDFFLVSSHAIFTIQTLPHCYQLACILNYLKLWLGGH